MPSLDKIEVNTKTLCEILDAVAEKKYTGDIIIIDTYKSFTIRDCDQQFLTEVKKPEPINEPSC